MRFLSLHRHQYSRRGFILLIVLGALAVAMTVAIMASTQTLILERNQDLATRKRQLRSAARNALALMNSDDALRSQLANSGKLQLDNLIEGAAISLSYSSAPPNSFNALGSTTEKAFVTILVDEADSERLGKVRLKRNYCALLAANSGDRWTPVLLSEKLGEATPAQEETPSE